MENSTEAIDSGDEIIDWRHEAQAIINDVKAQVKEIFISEKQDSDISTIYINIQTIEGRKYCVKVDASGFQIAGEDYDKVDTLTDNPEDVFETPYALLTTISQGYVHAFANNLINKLSGS